MRVVLEIAMDMVEGKCKMVHKNILTTLYALWIKYMK